MISLRSRLRRALLTYVFANRSARFYVREMAERLGVDPTNLSRELARLEKDGLFLSERQGRQLYYRLNPKYPFLKPLFTMLAASIGVAPTLQSALAGIEGIDSAFLYGSFAKNESDAASDIDLLIIGTPEPTALASAVRKAEKLLHREINYTFLESAELRRRLKARDPFFSDIWHGSRITLMEDGHEAAAG